MNNTSEIEEIVIKVFGEVLSLPVKEIDIENNFFLLGGDSLLGTQIVSKINDIFHIEDGLTKLFEAKNVGEYCQHIATLVCGNVYT